MHGGADQAGFALAPVAAGDWRVVGNVFQVQVVAGEEGGGIGECDVAQPQYFALPCSLSFKGSALTLLCSLPFQGVSAIRLRGTAARIDPTPGPLHRAGTAGGGRGFGWGQVRS